MEGTSRYWRLRITRLRIAAVAALIAAGLVLTAVAGSASATCFGLWCTKDVSLGIRNSSKTAIEVQICPRGHANNPGNTHDSPCDTVTETHIVEPGQRYIVFNTNPLGVIITSRRAHPYDPTQHRTLYFYVKNPDIGLPFFRAQGHEVELHEGDATVRDVNDVSVELRRYPDEDRNRQSVKLMRIEIRKWPGAG